MNLDNYDLPDDVKAKLLAEIQASQKAAIDTEVSGLKAKRDELLAKIAGAKGGDDMEAMKLMMKQLNDQREGELLKAGKIDELIKLKLEAETNGLNTQIAQSDELTKKLQDDLSFSQAANIKMQIENGMRMAAGEVKDFNQTATPDLLGRAANTWQMKDGAMIAFDGEKQLFNKEAKPITPTEWIEGMRETAPHFFGKPSGAGAKGGDGSAEGYDKYFHGDTRDFQKQSELNHKNPELYEKLKDQYAQGA